MGDNINFNTLLLIAIIAFMIFGAYWIYPIYLDYLNLRDDAKELRASIDDIRMFISVFKTTPEYRQIMEDLQAQAQQQLPQSQSRRRRY